MPPDNRSDTAPMRVQKYISRCGAASRREAEGLMRAGRVAINGEPVATMGAKVIPGADTVSLDGRILELAPLRWLVFHKPAGVLCTRSDPHGGQTIYDLLPRWAAGLRYVGRLDLDTSGLILLTNDGDRAAALAHPRSRVEREYLVRVRNPVTAATIRALRRGIELEDGLARPRMVRRAADTESGWDLKLVLAEGRKREVRRLLKAAGHPVTHLARMRFGPFRLGALGTGSFRPARPSELAAVRDLLRRRRRWKSPARARQSPRRSR